LAACLRVGDTAARIGGDEFALLVERVRAPSDAVAVAERVVAGLRAPVMIGTQEVMVSPSLGVALSGAAGTGPGDLLRAADVALYRAKAAGRGTYAVAEASPEEAPGVTDDLAPATSWLRGGPPL
jgi:diguanylate cyclase (GGDEF)-like protein